MTSKREDLNKLSVAEKRRLALQLLRERRAQSLSDDPIADLDLPSYTHQTYDQFLHSQGPEHTAAAPKMASFAGSGSTRTPRICVSACAKTWSWARAPAGSSRFAMATSA